MKINFDMFVRKMGLDNYKMIDYVRANAPKTITANQCFVVKTHYGIKIVYCVDIHALKVVELKDIPQELFF